VTRNPRDGDGGGPLPACIADEFVPKSRLGEGGFGVVYLADQLQTGTRTPWREVVVKVSRPNQRPEQEPVVVARALREAQVLSTLENDHLVNVISVGLVSPGRPFIAMKYAAGQTLEDILRVEGRLPWQRAFGIGVQICEALQECHRHKVIHRDLKPSNIMVETREGKDWVKVVDFGIAKVARDFGVETEPGIPTVSLTGRYVPGTPAYLSPEQATGGSADPRSDLYSLGVVLYEMVAGKPPFDGNSNALLRAHARVRPPALDPEVPPAVRAAIQRNLEKDPRYRFQSASQLREVLEAVLAGRPAPHARRQWPVVVATAAAAALVLGVAAVMLQLRPPAPHVLRPAQLLLRTPEASLRVKAKGVDANALNPAVPLDDRGTIEVTEPASGWTVHVSYTRDEGAVHATLASTPAAQVLDGDAALGNATVDLGENPRRLVLRAPGHSELVLLARVESSQGGR
jgi:serine/threonine-protein kinase